MPITEIEPDLFRFTPSVKTSPMEDPREWSQEDYANETMLFSADLPFARKHGGPITQVALDALEAAHPELHRNAAYAPDLTGIIDTRVHMLMPGMIPAIGGWHCDAVPRIGGIFKDQPDPRLYDERVTHYTITMAQGETSRTAFLMEPIDVSLPPGERVWTAMHKEITRKPRRVLYGSHNSVVKFDLGTPHKASVTSTPGWRFFFRYSLYKSTPRNQIRRQVQVYIPHEGHGW
jgi:hypothetical protein